MYCISMYTYIEIHIKIEKSVETTLFTINQWKSIQS